jgi:hypothetical protein
MQYVALELPIVTGNMASLLLSIVWAKKAVDHGLESG